MTSHLFDCVQIDCTYLSSTQSTSFAPIEKEARKYFSRKKETWKYMALTQAV